MSLLYAVFKSSTHTCIHIYTPALQIFWQLKQASFQNYYCSCKQHLKNARAGTLALQFCAIWVLVCWKIVEMYQITINSINNVMCNVNINDNYFKYFLYIYSSFILFHCDFMDNKLYDMTSVGVFFGFEWRHYKR